MLQTFTLDEALNGRISDLLHGHGVLEAIIWGRFFAGETIEIGPYIIHKSFDNPERKSEYEAYLHKAEQEGNLAEAQDGFYGYTTDHFYGHSLQLTEEEDSDTCIEVLNRVAYIWELQIKARYPARKFVFKIAEISDGEWGVFFHEVKTGVTV
jgi:hypothetical protein